MRLILPILLLAAGTAEAHVGHLGDVAGHDHWIAAAGLGLAVLVGVWGALRGDPKAEPEDGSEAETEGEGAGA